MTAPEPKKYHDRSFAGVTGWTRPQELSPFVQPNLERDSDRRIVLTIELARTHPDPLVRRMYGNAQEYWRRVDRIADDATKRIRGAGIELERRVSFPERAELRFGNTQFGHNGAGIGDGVLGAFLRDQLLLFPGFRHALITYPDALQLMPNFAGDRVTDALGTILLRDIIGFTQRCAARFDPRCLYNCEWSNVYNPHTGTIDPKFVAQVPVDDHGRPILLLPKEIVRGSCALEPADYLSRIQVNGRWVREKFSKSELLNELGLDAAAMIHFVGARLENVRMHKAFQEGIAKRRGRSR